MHSILEKNLKTLFEKTENEQQKFIKDTKEEKSNIKEQMHELQKKLNVLEEKSFANKILNVYNLYKDKVSSIYFELEYDSDDEGGTTCNLRPRISFIEVTSYNEDIEYKIYDMFYGYGEEFGEINVDFAELTSIYEKTKLNKEILTDKNNNVLNKI